MAGVAGDFEGLAELAARLKGLSMGSGRMSVIRAVSEAAMKQIDDEFRQGRDPYGKRWAPLTSRQGQPLLDTGAHLRNSLAPKLSPGGFSITTAFIGAPVHQYGATIKAKRAKALRFKAGGPRPRGYAKNNQAKAVFAQKVVIPQRQYMPEKSIGAIWGPALEASADDSLRSLMGNP